MTVPKRASSILDSIILLTPNFYSLKFKIRLPTSVDIAELDTRLLYNVIHKFIIMGEKSIKMVSKKLPINFDYLSPEGCEVRLLMNNHLGGLAHCTLKPDTVAKATKHKTVHEIWHILSGTGKIWLSKNGEEKVIDLEPGITVELAVGTEFQFRSGKREDLCFIIMTTPPWPGAAEAIHVQGKWEFTVEQELESGI